MKTADEILNENGLSGKLKCHNSELQERDRDDILEAMEEYGNLRSQEVKEGIEALIEKHKNKIGYCETLISELQKLIE